MSTSGASGHHRQEGQEGQEGQQGQQGQEGQEGQEGPIINLVCHFLRLITTQCSGTDPRIPQLEEYLHSRNPKAIPLMQQLKHENTLAALICSDEVIAEIQEDLGVAVKTDAECVKLLRQLKEKSVSLETQTLLDRAIEFVETPPGTELTSEPPFIDLLTVFETMNEVEDAGKLHQCLRYMTTMIETTQ
jgi:hypothetical protein